MKTFTHILICVMFFCSMTARTQNAPVTTAGIVADCRSDVIVPVKVTNFVDIGAISLTMDFNIGIVHITSVSPNVLLPGFTYDYTTIPGRLVMGWFGNTGVTLPNNTVIVNISFGGLIAGDTPLTWIDNGISCEYAKYDNGAYTPLNDSPIGDYYHNGHITWVREGPVTIAPVFNPVPNQVNCIPFKVNQFTDIGAISLTIDYDPLVLVFTGINSTNIPDTWSLSGLAVNPGRLIVGGLGPSLSLSDGDVLFNACFSYVCGTSTLKFWDGNQGIACEYADAATMNPLCDLPQSDFYIDGLVKNVPIANADVNTTNEDVAVSGDAAVNDIPACVGDNVWSLVGPDGGASNGTVVFNNDGTYTYTPDPNYNGTDVFTYKICDVNGNCDQATVTITVFPVDEPDLSPTITTEPNVMHGVTHFDIIIKVSELNNAPTNGTITVFIPIDSRWVLDGGFDQSATMIGSNPVNNSIWTYSTNGTSHVFTTTSVFSPLSIMQFGFHALWSNTATEGVFTITSQIVSGSGGENRDDNNVDAEMLDYFIN